MLYGNCPQDQSRTNAGIQSPSQQGRGANLRLVRTTLNNRLRRIISRAFLRKAAKSDCVHEHAMQALLDAQAARHSEFAVSPHLFHTVCNQRQT
jgi:hypothetical protein